METSTFQLPPALAERYLLLGLIGSGGMGQVLHVLDRQLRREVALKLIRPEMLTDETRQRFLREAQTLSRLSHPALVRVLDADAQGEVPFLAMELVPGESLARRLTKGTFLRASAVDILAELLDALAQVHASGFLHRDIKPSNVLLRPDGRPVLIDFGVVYDVSRTELTAVGDLVGTPRFLAPELMHGEWHTERSDLFALGMTGLAMLSTADPYATGPDEPTSGRRVAWILTSGRYFQQARAQLEGHGSAGLVLLSSLEPEPGARPVSAMAMREALLASRSAGGSRQARRSHSLMGTRKVLRTDRLRSHLRLAGAALVAAALLWVAQAACRVFWPHTLPDPAASLIPRGPSGQINSGQLDDFSQRFERIRREVEAYFDRVSESMGPLLRGRAGYRKSWKELVASGLECQRKVQELANRAQEMALEGRAAPPAALILAARIHALQFSCWATLDRTRRLMEFTLSPPSAAGPGEALGVFTHELLFIPLGCDGVPRLEQHFLSSKQVLYLLASDPVRYALMIPAVLGDIPAVTRAFAYATPPPACERAYRTPISLYMDKIKHLPGAAGVALGKVIHGLWAARLPVTRAEVSHAESDLATGLSDLMNLAPSARPGLSVLAKTVLRKGARH